LSAADAEEAEPVPENDALPPRVHKKTSGTFVPMRDGAGAVSSTERVRRVPHRLAASASGSWRDHLYWVLLAALIPLAVSTLFEGRPLAERLEETLGQHPEVAARLQQAVSKDDFFGALPERRLVGAHLPHGTWVHWGYAAISATLFLVVLTQSFPNEAAGPSRLLWTGFITGTVGIVLLLGFQWVASFTDGWVVRGWGIGVLIFYIVKFIGFSYRSALDPANGFALSFMGFTCGVGLCEELCKAVPVMLFLRGQPHAGWKAACVVGLASGVGFGVSEGITYSSDSYNGVAEGLTYLVRFASCVALHATWAGSVALLMCRNQDFLGDDGFDWGMAGNFIVHYLSIAMVLHGLYDTLLKKDHELWALAIAVGSFAWLAWLVWQERSE
jgi:RsiW-degrading membrane proteinase PrsW (M82 family)